MALNVSTAASSVAPLPMKIPPALGTAIAKSITANSIAASNDPSGAAQIKLWVDVCDILVPTIINTILAHIQTQGTLNLAPGLTPWIASGIPVPMDGGAALQASLAANTGLAIGGPGSIV